MTAGVALLLICLGAIGALVGLQRLLRWASQRQVGRPVPVIAAPEERRLQLLLNGVLWFHTPTCGPCHAMRPGLERWIAAGEIRAIDATEYPEVALAFGVLGTPTLIRIRGGHIDAVHVGGMSPGAVAEFVEG